MSDASPPEGWPATDFLAKHHIIDAALSTGVRVDPYCTADCETAQDPGDGSPDFGTVKEVTGIDLGLLNPGNQGWMSRFRQAIADGRIANARMVFTYPEIEIARDREEYSAMTCLQIREPPEWELQGDVSKLQEWYDEGLRVLQLADSTNNHGPNERLGYGDKEGDENGVTELGRTAIARMNALGMIVDVSHCSKQTALDAAEISAKPIIATHANAKALNPHPRTKDDQELQAIAATGGVIGVTTIRWMLDTDGDGAAGMDDMIAHIEYMVGIDHVGVSTDAKMDGWDQNSVHYADADLAAMDR